MKLTKLSLACVLALFLATCFAATGMAKEATGMVNGKKVTFVKLADNFIVLYDRSSSMAAMSTESLRRIDVEKQILVEKNSTLPNLDWQAGIYSFTPGFGKNAFVTHLPMATYDKAAFTKAIDSLPAKPSGTTLLQYGLVSLDSILAGLKGQTVVFLFTDGQYTNNKGLPKPGDLAKELAKKYDVCFYVIDTDQMMENGDAAIARVANASECGKVINFSKLLGHPEWLTNPLFMLKEGEQPAPVVGTSVNNVLFDFDKTDIKPEFFVPLNELAILLQNNPKAQVTLAGHTDNIGTKEYNIDLSQRRAASVRAYLVEKGGIDNKRITLSWFGKSNPVASNDTEEGRAQNRRVESIITGM